MKTIYKFYIKIRYKLNKSYLESKSYKKLEKMGIDDVYNNKIIWK